MTASNPAPRPEGYQVGRRGGGQHQRPALGPVPGQDLEGPRLDQVDQGPDGLLARPAGAFGGPVAHDGGRGPGQTDEGHRLTEPVVEPVHQAVPGEVASGDRTPSASMAWWKTGPLADRISVRSRSTKTAPVPGVGMPSRYRRSDAPGHRSEPETAPDAGKGVARGGGDSFALTQQG